MASKVVGNLVVNLAADIADFRSDMRKAATESQRQMRKIEKESAAMRRKIKQSLDGVGAAFAALGIGMAVRSVIRATAEYERLGAALITVEGSQKKANAQFKELEKFASTTPFQLQEVVNGWIKLKARGLDPSIASLRSFGNVAGAMGKSLDQFIEAVGDAASGEMERLKEFGITAKQEGDKVKFTFQGVTTEVGRNAREITAYLQNLGDTTFAGGMERQANTLGGAISNLQDAVFSLMAGGNVEGLKDAIRELSETLTDPQVKEGLQNFATFLVKMAEWSARGASGVATIAQWLGEEFARLTNGLSLEDQISETEKRLRTLAAAGHQNTKVYRELAEQLLVLRQQMAAISPPEVQGAGQARGARPASPEDRGKKNDAAMADYIAWLDPKIAEEAKIRQEEMNAIRKEAAALTESVMTAQERYNAELAHYKQFLEAGNISQETFNRLVEESKERLKESKEGFDIMKSAAEEAGRSMQSALADFFYNMDGNIRNMAQNFIDAMRRMIAQMLAFKAMQGLAGSIPGFGSFFQVPGHAAIGGIHSGPTVVGEHGPELLNLPRGSSVTPNSKMGSNVTVNVDARGRSGEDIGMLMAAGGKLREILRNDMAYFAQRGHFPA